MGMNRWFSSVYRTLKLTRKSDRAEFMLYMKLVLLGFGVVGAIGFVIYLIAAYFMLLFGVPNTSTVP